VFAVCNKCNAKTKHRIVNDARPGKKSYPACSICLENNSKKHRKKHWYRYLAQKANARKRKGSIKLTEQIVLSIATTQKFKCALTNVTFNIESKWYKPSLDRIDSNKGYTKNNIRLVAWIVNHCRGDLTDNDFIDMCKKVARRTK
jgi:hypothetical protein